MAAICSSNGFDAAELRSAAETSLAAASEHSGDDFNTWIKEFRLPEQSHYSRLMAVGLLALLEAAHGELKGEEAAHGELKGEEAAELRKRAVEISKEIGMPEERVEKDLGIFASSSERMQQAVELMEETLAAERRKKEKRMAEAAEKKQSQSS